MLLKDLLKGIEYETLKGSLDVEISDVIYNSDMLKPNSAFICKKGAKFDSHTIAQEAVDKGATAIICDRDVVAENCTVIKVENTSIAECLMAANLYDHPAEKMVTIGITASKGKTTTAFMVKQILEKGGHKVGIMGSIGSFAGDKELDPHGHTTTPAGYEVQRLFAEMYEAGCDTVVMETTSQAFKVNRLAGITFNYGIFLNISRDHISSWEHASLEEYMSCKKQLLKQSRVGVVNFDDLQFQKIIDGNDCEKLITFGFYDGADIQIKDYKQVSEPQLGIQYHASGLMDVDINVGVPGRFTAYNSVAAAYVCSNLGVSDDVISTALSDIKIRGRVEKIDIDAPYTVIIDFAHNGIGVTNLMNAIRNYDPNKIIAVFGSDGNRTKIRRADAGEILGKTADLTILTSNCPRFEEVEDINNDIKVGLDRTSGAYMEIIDRRSAIKYAMSIAEQGDFILLIGKGHWDYEEIKGVFYPFDERVVVKELYEELKNEAN